VASCRAAVQIMARRWPSGDSAGCEQSSAACVSGRPAAPGLGVSQIWPRILLVASSNEYLV